MEFFIDFNRRGLEFALRFRSCSEQNINESNLSPSRLPQLFHHSQIPQSLMRTTIRTPICSPSMFCHLLSLCENTTHLKSIKTLLIVQDLLRQERLLGRFFEHCFHLGSYDFALSTFNTVKKPSVYLQNLTIRALSNGELHENVVSVYAKCKNSRCPSDEFTFPLVIKACSALRAFETGKVVHGVVLRTGYEKNVYVQTALVDFYAKNGYLVSARSVIDKIPQPDLVSWNALIAGYSLHGYEWESLQVFKHVFTCGLKPNLITLASVVPLCTRLKCFGFGISLHSFALKCGYSVNVVLVPALISMYVGDGNLAAATELFHYAPEKGIEVWNAMISAYAQTKMPFRALEVFRGMLSAGLKPNSITFVSIIPSCEISDSVLYGESFHACAIKHGSENQISVSTATVSMYARLGEIDKAEFLFDQIPNRSLLLWNVMISGYVHNGMWNASLETFGEMLFAGFSPDAVSIVSLLSACRKLGALLLGKSVHAFCIRKGLDSNLSASNALMAIYSDCGHSRYSFKLFDKMGRSVVSWNIMISKCVHDGQIEKAVDLLHEMQEQGLTLDLLTMLSIVPICCKIEGMSLHGYAIKNGFDLDVSLTNALISMYSKCGNLEAGRLLFESMPRGVVSWNALITGYRSVNSAKEVFTLFSRMIQENQRPNSVTLLNLLPLCTNKLQGKSIHAFAIRTEILMEATLFTSLIHMYAGFENLKSCIMLFEMGKDWNISVWNAIISAHVATKHNEKAVGLFCDMLRLDFQPDKITSLGLISACSNLGDLNLANSIFACMVCRGFYEDTVIVNALMDLHAKCGNILTAEKLFDSLIEKNTVSWNVMINGYNIHGNGEAAFRLFSAMESSGVKPDDYTFSSILSACSHTGLVSEGWSIFKSMPRHGLQPSMDHYTALLNMLGRNGHLMEAYNIIKQLHWKPSIGLLESLLNACAVHNSLEFGEKIGAILSELYPENSGTYVTLSNMYAVAGRWTEADKVRANIEERQLRKLPGTSLLMTTNGSRNHDG